jgi:hypothetical protein
MRVFYDMALWYTLVLTSHCYSVCLLCGWLVSSTALYFTVLKNYVTRSSMWWHFRRTIILLAAFGCTVCSTVSVHELNVIHNILYNNSYTIDPQKPTTFNQRKQATSHTTHKWACVTYVGKETTYITNILKKSELKIAFRTTHTLGNLIHHKDHTPDKFSLSGVYKLTCSDCHKTYVGQTGRQFRTGYKEHKAAFRNNSNTSRFAKHLFVYVVEVHCNLSRGQVYVLSLMIRNIH